MILVQGVFLEGSNHFRNSFVISGDSICGNDDYDLVWSEKMRDGEIEYRFTRYDG
jgi:hypothetical protein